MKILFWIQSLFVFVVLNTFSSTISAEYGPNHQALAASQLCLTRPDNLDVDWHLHDYFGNIMIINIQGHTERLQFAANNLQAVGAKTVEILYAINGRTSVDPSLWKKMDWNWVGYNLNTEDGRKKFDHQRQGEIGCYLSHYLAIKTVKERYDNALKELQEAKDKKNVVLQKKAYQDVVKNRNVLILEDDNGFGIVGPNGKSVTLASVGTIFRQAMMELPQEWDMLYLVTYSRPPYSNQKFSPHLAKVGGGFTTSAYAVNHTMYDTLIAELGKVFDPKVEHIFPVDDTYAKLHKDYNCYAIVPSIAYQNEGVSFITSQYGNFRQMQPLHNYR